MQKSIKFISTNLNRSSLQAALGYQAAITSSQSVGQRSPVGDKIAL